MPMFPIDICLFSDHNVLDKAVEHRIFNWIRSGRIGFIWCGMPCTSFSRARKWDGLGPGPIRSPDFLRGLPDLNDSDRRKVLTGNNLLLFTLRLLRLCERCHVPHALENPCQAWLGILIKCRTSSHLSPPRSCFWTTANLEKSGRSQLSCSLTVGTLHLYMLDVKEPMVGVAKQADHTSRCEDVTTAASL